MASFAALGVPEDAQRGIFVDNAARVLGLG
jgi:predicted TIM-barrel fold metal-dependent hydrolase